MLISLDAVLARSDALVLCAARTGSSRGIIGRDALAKVKPGLILVNVARGGLVDEVALDEALRDGLVAYAAMDVRSPDPPDPAHHPLAGLDNAITTPRIASASVEAIADLVDQLVARILTILGGAGRIAPGSARA